MSGRILVVDDEEAVVELVTFHLARAGYHVITTSTGGGALEAVEAKVPDLVVLDVGLPDMEGTEVCRRLRRDRRTESVPIVILSARSEEIDRVVALELGADDYVTKPFSPRELVLRVGAVLRRVSTAPPEMPADRIVVGRLDIDRARHRVLVDGAAIYLTALEHRLLCDLAERRGRVQTRDALLSRVWGYAPDADSRTVDTHVRRLRDKLGEARDWIETVRGVGYRFRDDEP